jgi:hypothetical protein
MVACRPAWMLADLRDGAARPDALSLRFGDCRKSRIPDSLDWDGMTAKQKHGIDP